MAIKLNSFSSYLIYLATIIAFIIPGPAEKIKWTLDILLILIMTFSIIEFKFQNNSANNWKEAIKLTILHYGILSTLFIIATYFVENIEYKKGMIMLAIIPPAISLMAITKLQKSNINNSFLGILCSYIFSIIYIPIIAVIFLHEKITLGTIIQTIILYLAIPYIISRALRQVKILTDKKNNMIINISYSLLFYILIGINRDTFLYDFKSIWILFVIMIVLTFVLGTIIFLIAYKKKNSSHALDYMLFGTYKNTGLAAVIGFNLLGSAAIVPISIRAFFSPVYTIYIFILKDVTDGIDKRNKQITRKKNQQKY